MAVVKAISYSSSGGKKALSHTISGLGIVINYATRGDKTQGENEVINYVSGVNCNAKFAKDEFLLTKALHKKTDGVQFYHYTQSFAEDDNLTAEEAHQIGLEFAKRAWQGFEVVVATHTDTHCIHNHFVINSVNAQTGYKYHTNYEHLKKLRNISDEICLAHGLSIIKPSDDKKASGVGNKEYQSAKKGESWKFRLRSTIKRAMEKCGTKEAFINYMKAAGYEVRWNDQYKNIKYTCTKEKKHKNGKYPECNDDKLSDEKYLKENMEYEFKLRYEEDNGRADGNASARRTGNSTGEGGGRDTRRNAYRDAGSTVNNSQARASDSNRDAEADKRNRASEFDESAFGEHGVEANERSARREEESCRDRRENQTGWENEREKYRANRESYKNQTRGNKRAYGSTVDNGVRNDRKFDSTLYNSVGSLIHAASLSSDSNKTPEEIEAEEEARRNGEGFGALVGAGVLVYDYLASQNEPQATAEDEDADQGFTMHM